MSFWSEARDIFTAKISSIFNKSYWWGGGEGTGPLLIKLYSLNNNLIR